MLEALSGMNVNVRFLKLQDIRTDGVPPDIDVLIIRGSAETAFAGSARVWEDGQLTAQINRYVAAGGGLVGVGKPSAVAKNGRYFQLAQLLGVDEERSVSLSTNKYPPAVSQDHFLLTDTAVTDFGRRIANVYALNHHTTILHADDRHSVQFATKTTGQGRSVYLAGLPYSASNSRLLMRVLYYAAHQEDLLALMLPDDPQAEVAIYPERQRYVVINNSPDPVETDILIGDQPSAHVRLAGYGSEWRALPSTVRTVIAKRNAVGRVKEV